jgi:hypothetical protein
MQRFVRDAARDGVAANKVELHRFRRVMALGRSLPGAFLTWTNWWLPRNHATVTSQSPVTGRLERANLIPPPRQDTLRLNSSRMPFCAGQPIANYPIQIANFQLPLRPIQAPVTVHGQKTDLGGSAGVGLGYRHHGETTCQPLPWMH